MVYQKGTSPVHQLNKKIEEIKTQIFSDRTLSEDAKMRLIEMVIRQESNKIS